MFGSVVELQALENAARFRRWEGFVERGRRVGVQVILDEPNVLGVRINLIHEPAHHLGVILHGALLGHFHVPPARQRLPTAPKALQARLSRDPAAKAWTCPRCGLIPPLAFAEGWYARRPCRCEEAAWEARERERLREETAHARAALTYTWLGRAWAEPHLSTRTFATFERERQPDAFEQALAFAERPHGTLAFFGAFGTGKTHLLAAIANAQIEQGRPCRFASAVSLFDAVQERLERKQDYHELLRQAISTPLLLLDDVDKLKPSEFREETLYKLLNGRNVAGLPLAISTNNPPGALARWVGEAGRSRLMQGILPVPMDGPDYRLAGNS